MQSDKFCNAQSLTEFFINSLCFLQKSRSISAKSEIKVFYNGTLRDNQSDDVTMT